MTITRTCFQQKTNKDIEMYIDQLKDGSTESKEEAKKALIRTGVLTKNGKKKRVIVSWEQITDMYEKLPNLTIGFHGCSQETYEKVILYNQPLKASENSYDWLGHGIYFWEQNLQRAKEWSKRRYGKDSAVIGAVIVIMLV